MTGESNPADVARGEFDALNNVEGGLGFMAKKKASTTKGRSKVKKVMHEYKGGKLKSGSGGKVKSKKQAVAIALSEARQSGAKIPKKKHTTKKKS